MKTILDFLYSLGYWAVCLLLSMWNAVWQALPICLLIALLLMVIHTAANKRYWIKRAAKDIGIPNGPNKVKEWLAAEVSRAQDACLMKTGKKMRVICTMPLDKRDTLFMGACFRWTRLISFSPVWVYNMHGLEDASLRVAWKVAFHQSIGHELGHQFDKQIGWRKFFLSKEEKKLFLWLREVRCDLFSLRFLTGKHGFCRPLIQQGLDLKIDTYTRGDQEKKDRFTKTHPSWTIRREIMEHYPTITKGIIDMLADKAGCKNRAFIYEMYELYEAATAEHALSDVLCGWD